MSATVRVMTERQVRDEIADILIQHPRLRRAHWKACGCCPTYWPDTAEETAAMHELASLRWLLRATTERVANDDGRRYTIDEVVQRLGIDTP